MKMCYSINFKTSHSKFVTYENPAGIYSIEDVSEAIQSKGDHEETLQNEYDNINVKTKSILTHLGGTFGTLGFDVDEKFFVNFLLGFTLF